MENLENVKVGDVLYCYNGLNSSLATVERLTPTLVITKHNKFRKKDCASLGGDCWSRTHARLATKEDIAKFKRIEYINKCRTISFDKLTDTQLQEILNIAYPKK